MKNRMSVRIMQRHSRKSVFKAAVNDQCDLSEIAKLNEAIREIGVGFCDFSPNKKIR